MAHHVRVVMAVANWLLRQLARLVDGLMPDPDRRSPVDPRIEPETLESFGREQIKDFGSAHSHQMASPAGATQALDMARAARQDGTPENRG